MRVVKVVNGDEVITYNGILSISISSFNGVVVLRNCDDSKSYLYLSKDTQLLVYGDG